jgi:hypothetical protein
MKKLLTLILLLGCSTLFSQNLIQTYMDRCTGAVTVFTVPMNGQTTVAFYNKSKTFTSAQFQNGELQSWLEQTYLWWATLNPCSTAQTNATTTQQQTQQTTQQATQAAENAAKATQALPVVETPPTPVAPAAPTPTANAPSTDTNVAPTTSAPETSTAPVDTSSTDTSASTTDVGSQGSTNEPTSQGDTSGTTETSTGETGTAESTTEATTTETSESQNETQQTESTSDDSGGSDTSGSETEDSSTTQDEGGSESEATTEESNEETTTESEESTETEESEIEETTEESSEETTEEESTEESTEEESTEEESTEEESESEDEESSEEESEEESEDESEEESEEETEDEESTDNEEEDDKKKKKKKQTLGPPIITSNVASMQGLDGTYSYATTIGVSRSSLIGDKTYGLNAMVYTNLQQFMLTANFSKIHINKEGRVSRVYSASAGAAKMFTTLMANMNHSVVFLGKKGSASGVALGTSITSLELNVVKGLIYYDENILSQSITGFYTKPIPMDRLTISPMLAVSVPFASLEMYSHRTTWSTDIMVIGGSSFTYSLTKRFGINLGANAIYSTLPNFPIIMSYTIGSRFSF